MTCEDIATQMRAWLDGIAMAPKRTSESHRVASNILSAFVEIDIAKIDFVRAKSRSGSMKRQRQPFGSSESFVIR